MTLSASPFIHVLNQDQLKDFMISIFTLKHAKKPKRDIEVLIICD